MTYRGSFFISVEETLDLVFLRSDAMGFVPVDFRMAYRTIVKLHLRCAFQLPPAPLAIRFPQPSALAQGGPGRNRLRVRDCADNFEVHALAPLTGRCVPPKSLRSRFDDYLHPLVLPHLTPL